MTRNESRFDPHEAHAILERLNRIEQENKRLRRFGVLGVLAIAGLLLIGPTRPDPQENQAERFRLIDSEGKTRASLGVGAEGPELTFFDAGDRSRVSIGATNDGARIRLFDAQGRVRSRLAVGPKGTELALLDSAGVSRAGLTVSSGPSGSSFLSLRDPAGMTRAQLEAERDGPQLNLYGDAGKVEARLRVQKTEGAGLTLSDARGKQRGTFLVNEDGWPAATLWDAVNSRAGFSLNAGGPRLTLANDGLDRRAILSVEDKQMGLTLTRDRTAPVLELVEKVHGGAPVAANPDMRCPQITLYSPVGRGDRAVLWVFPDGSTDFIIRNKAGNQVFRRSSNDEANYGR